MIIEKVKTTLYFDKDLLEKLDEKCKKEHRNRSETIRMLIEKYLQEA